MQISICDDDPGVRDALWEWIGEYGKEHGQAFSVRMFSSAEDYLREGLDAPIVFMDIYMSGIDGIQAVRDSTEAVGRQVVFTTTSRDHAIEAFSLGAAHYLLKPLQKDEVWEALDRYLARVGQRARKSLSFKTRLGPAEIPMDQIVYIEVANKLCIVHSDKDSAFESRTSLDALCEQLDERFLRVQRSFVINMDYVDSFLSDRAVMRDGMEIMLSRQNRPELRKTYQDYLFRTVRGDGV